MNATNTAPTQQPTTHSEPECGGYELAERVTGLCRNTLYSLVHEERIPFIRLSPRMVRFRRADLDAWLSANAHGPKPAAR